MITATHCSCAASYVADELHALGATNDTHVRGEAAATCPNCCDDTGTASDTKPLLAYTTTEATPVVAFTDVDTTNAEPGSHPAADAAVAFVAAGGTKA